MSNGTSRLIWLIVALGVGFLAGWFVHRPPTPAVPKGTAAILVGPRASDLSIPKVKLSKADHDVLFWVSKRKDVQLFVEFQDKLFENMQLQSNGRYRVACGGRTCSSGEIDAATAADSREHKYWQILIDTGGVRDEADGWIIIDP